MVVGPLRGLKLQSGPSRKDAWERRSAADRELSRTPHNTRQGDLFEGSPPLRFCKGRRGRDVGSARVCSPRGRLYQALYREPAA